MSHYSVGVILGKEAVDKFGFTNALVQALAPFDEDLEVEEHPMATIEKVEKDFNEFKEVVKIGESNIYNVDYLKQLEKEGHLDSISAYIKSRYWGDEEDDQKTRKTPEGIPYTTYNSNAKWDWYTVGGRWRNLIDGNSCLVKDIALKKELSVEKKAHLKEYYDAITTELEDRTAEQKELLKEDFLLYKPKYYREAYPTFDDYLDARSSFSTYAVLTSDGEWFEPGQMGWFGMSHSTPHDETHFYQKFAEIIQKANKEDTFVVVDCHI